MFSKTFPLNFRNHPSGSYPVKRVLPPPTEFTGDSPNHRFAEETSGKISDDSVNFATDRRRTSGDLGSFKADAVKKRNLFTDRIREDVPFGIVYSQGRAIGVLKVFLTLSCSYPSQAIQIIIIRIYLPKNTV